MSYGHLQNVSIDRHNGDLDQSVASTSFQHPSLTQALRPHLPPRSYQDVYSTASATSPIHTHAHPASTLHAQPQNQPQGQNQSALDADPSNSAHAQQAQQQHSPHTAANSAYARTGVSNGGAGGAGGANITSPALKRKHIDALHGAHILKRRRDSGVDDPNAPSGSGSASGTGTLTSLNPLGSGGEDYENENELGGGGGGGAGGAGAKHWTDEEKSRLFVWLMGPGQDEHWNSLRATKNSCLRECATTVFNSKKTYQALKGCYERNFNLFKQIYAFEAFHASTSEPNTPDLSATSHSHNPQHNTNNSNSNSNSNSGNNNGASHSIHALPESDRLREYERRLQAARKAGCDVGNITARTVDHWHRAGWYELFYRRWHGDPATTRPPVMRQFPSGASTAGGVAGEDGEGIDDENNTSMEYGVDSAPSVNGINGVNGLESVDGHAMHAHGHLSEHQQTPQHPHHNPHPHQQPPIAFIHHPHSHVQPAQTQHTSQLHAHGQMHGAHAMPPPPSFSPSPTLQSTVSHPPHQIPKAASASYNNISLPGQTPNYVSFPPTLLPPLLTYLQTATQTLTLKHELLRRRDEREERECVARRQAERVKAEREGVEWEAGQRAAAAKQKADRALEVLKSPAVDGSVKAAAGDFLKKLFASE